MDETDLRITCAECFFLLFTQNKTGIMRGVVGGLVEEAGTLVFTILTPFGVLVGVKHKRQLCC